MPKYWYISDCYFHVMTQAMQRILNAVATAQQSSMAGGVMVKWRIDGMKQNRQGVKNCGKRHFAVLKKHLQYYILTKEIANSENSDFNGTTM